MPHLKLIIVCIPLLSLLIFSLSFSFNSCHAQSKDHLQTIEKRLKRLQLYFDLKAHHYVLLVDSSTQKMSLIKNKKLIKSYSISTAKNGIGSLENSQKTPPGTHKIKEKIGTGLPLGAIFKARQFTGKIAPVYKNKHDLKTDFITTRIMWLEGLEKGINSGEKVDSYRRFIYIHGTPEEGLLGQVASEGCIRMGNRDISELYQLVKEGTLVDIF